MATYRIKQGESLKLRYGVDDIDDLSNYSCHVQIIREDASGDDCDMELTPDNTAFIGNIPSSVTGLLEPKMYILLVLITDSEAEVPPDQSRRFEVHDKLIVEEGSLYVAESPGT